MTCASCGAALEPGAAECASCGAPVPAAGDTVAVEPLTITVDAPPAPASEAAGAKYTLQFSTGETVQVSGSGLVGRAPAPQPGESFEHLVAVTDVGMSVSKTHLEFGQGAAGFWVADRFSTNGTTVREPGVPSRRAEPGRRNFVVRGSRIDIGEQFFVVT